MSEFVGHFIWHELMTPDMAGAEAFYRKVVGWDAMAMPQSSKPYTCFLREGRPMAGLMVLAEAAQAQGARPGWIGHVGVADVDVCTAMAQDLGGVVHVPPQDVPDIGRFAVLGDPQGALFAVFAPKTGQPGTRPPMEAPGQVGWNELLAADGATAFGFYQSLFGWQKSEAMDMGEMGVYQTFGLGGPAFGGIFTKPPEVPMPFWVYYLTVEDIDEGLARVAGAGGQVLMGPMEVPGGRWILQAMDPQGAMFALLGKRP